MRLIDKETIERKDLISLSEVIAQRPSPIGCMSTMFCQYKGTGAYQWWVNSHAGFWKPHGDVLVGLRAPQESNDG